MNELFTEFFFDSLMRDGRVSAEIVSPNPKLRRWVELIATRECMLDNNGVFEVNNSPVITWKLIVFDFDHTDSETLSDDCMDQNLIYSYCESNKKKRKIVCEFQTTELNKYEQKIKEYVKDQSLFRWFQPDFPYL
jgi:hypothetical protein